MVICGHHRHSRSHCIPTLGRDRSRIWFQRAFSLHVSAVCSVHCCRRRTVVHDLSSKQAAFRIGVRGMWLRFASFARSRALSRMRYADCERSRVGFAARAITLEAHVPRVRTPVPTRFAFFSSNVLIIRWHKGQALTRNLHAASSAIHGDARVIDSARYTANLRWWFAIAGLTQV